MKNQLLLGLFLLAAGQCAEGQSLLPNPNSATVASIPAVNPAPEFVAQTASERLRSYIVNTFGVESIVRAAIGGAIAQANNRPYEWRQGAEAYGERTGNSYAIHVIRGTLEYGAATALHEDNRYVRLGGTGFGKRSAHAVLSGFIAHDYGGHSHFAYSRFGSALGASFISREWQPRSADRAGDAATNFGTIISLDIAGNFAKEFWPDFRRRVRRH